MSQGYDSQTAKFLAMVATCLPGLTSDQMGHYIGQPKELRRKLFALLPDVPEFPVWASVTVGKMIVGSRVHEEYFRGENSFVDMNSGLRSLLLSDDVPLLRAEREVDLVLASVGKLGFHDEAHRGDVIERAESIGLVLPPVEVAFEIGRHHAAKVAAIVSSNEWHNKQLTVATPFVVEKFTHQIMVDHRFGEHADVYLGGQRKFDPSHYLVFEKPRTQ